MPEVIIQKNILKELVVNKFISANVPIAQAEVVAEVLIHADLRGIHSHGVLRTEHYIKRFRKGGVNPKPKFQKHRHGKVSLLFDGDHAFGHYITKDAMKEAILLAKENGIGIVGIKNSSHCGALSYYAQQAVDQEVICMIMSQTDSIVVPFGGSEPYFGTNPIAYGIPSKQQKPIILDMATSNVALGKILDAKASNKSIPTTWGVDENGVPVTNPNLVKYLLPLGGAKGYGLALVVDVLSGILTGSAFGTHITKMYSDYEQNRKLGHFILTIDPALFIDKEIFLENVDQMIEELHSIKPQDGFDSVLVPGEPEQSKEETYLKNGIPISKSTYDYLTS